MNAEAPPPRFWAKVNKLGPKQPHMKTRCWVWTGATTEGYGRFSWNGKPIPAHHMTLGRRLHKLVTFKIEPDHLCRNRKCVRPSHLELVTHQTNVLRGMGIAAINARKKVCPEGHPLIGTNIMRTDKGKSRRCRECARLRCKRLYAEGKK